MRNLIAILLMIIPTIAFGKTLTHGLGSVTDESICTWEATGSQLDCDIADLAGLNTALGSGVVTGAHTTDTGPTQDCTGTQLQGAGGACIDDLAELNTALGDAGVVTGSHTSDTSADTICSGTGNYLDGEGNCDALVTDDDTIDSGTAPTVDSAGEIAVDTSDNGDASGQLVYWDGTAAAVATDVRQECVTVEALADTDDGKPVWMNAAYTSVVLQTASCNCLGTCTAEADITLKNDDGSAAAMTGDVTCEDTTAGDTATALSGAEATIDFNDVVTIDVTNTPTADDDYIICLTYKVVRQ